MCNESELQNGFSFLRVNDLLVGLGPRFTLLSGNESSSLEFY